MTGTADVVKTTVSRITHADPHDPQSGLDHLPQTCIHWTRMTAFDQLGTEARDTASADLDLRSTRELVELMNAEDATVPAAVGAAAGQIATLVDAIVARLGEGGRLVYAGAGTSGRLAALDAAECGPTFAAGALVLAVAAEQEADEDDAAAGGAAIEALSVSPADAVVGISASGRSPYVRGALEAARSAGALTGCVVCVHGSELAAIAHHEVAIPVGAEVLAGSTRLKAGTAQKLVLNMVSTISMIRLGRTYGNLMVGLDPANEKLQARARSIVAQATGAANGEVEQALEAAGGDARVAIVSLLTGLDAAAARARLDAAGGVVRRAVEQP
jgi:N-acetylmuramic acid 6-phosphate etherase